MVATAIRGRVVFRAVRILVLATIFVFSLLSTFAPEVVRSWLRDPSPASVPDLQPASSLPNSIVRMERVRA